MLFKGLLATALSGKVDGLVASHNKGGTYFRNLAIPTNPNTPQQQVVRAQFANLTAAWQDSLTQLQRDAWQLYADNVTVTNRLGDQVNISGLAMFVRNNVSRVFVAQTFNAIAPSIFNLGTITRPLLNNASEATQTADFVFSNSPSFDPWANEAGSLMLVFLSRPQNSGVQFFRGPYRFAGSLEGDPVPPVPPFTVTVPFPILAGQKIFGRAIAMYLDSRYTVSRFNSEIVVA